MDKQIKIIAAVDLCARSAYAYWRSGFGRSATVKCTFYANGFCCGICGIDYCFCRENAVDDGGITRNLSVWCAKCNKLLWYVEVGSFDAHGG